MVHDSGNVLAGRYRVNALPAAVVIGHDGRVAWVGGPEHPEQALRQAALEAEKVRKAPPAATASPSEVRPTPG